MKFSYTHTQDIASDTWNVFHNLGVEYPITDVIVVIDSVKTKIIPHAIEAQDSNFLKIKFTKNFTGKARLI